MKNNSVNFLIIVACTVLAAPIYAGELTIPNSFSPNTPAVAAQVNANFSAVKTEVDDNDSRVDDLAAMVMALQSTVNQLQTDLTAAETTITTQQNQINQLQTDLTAAVTVNSTQQTQISQLLPILSNSVLALDGYLKLTTFSGYDTAEFSGLNVQINNGSGSTEGAVDGLGNLIIGYNENTGMGRAFCSDPQYIFVQDCIANSGTWDQNITTGSHNLVLGTEQSFTSYGSFIAGTRNVSQGIFSSVSAGLLNWAAGDHSSISSGGFANTAQGANSTVSGGQDNRATGESSTVSGGHDGVASGYRSWWGGGYYTAL